MICFLDSPSSSLSSCDLSPRASRNIRTRLPITGHQDLCLTQVIATHSHIGVSAIFSQAWKGVEQNQVKCREADIALQSPQPQEAACRSQMLITERAGGRAMELYSRGHFHV